MNKFLSFILSLGLIISPIPWNSRAHASDFLKDLPSQVVGVANGVIGSSILVKCKLGSLQPSVMLYMGGSVVYILGEIDQATSKLKQMNDQALELDQLQSGSVVGGDYQKASLEAQLKNEEENLRFIKRRKLLITGVSITYTAATVLALLETLGVVVKPDDAFCVANPSANKFVLKALGDAYSTISSARGNLSINSMAGGLAVGLLDNKILSKSKIEPITNLVEPVAVPLINKGPTRTIYFTLLTTFVFVDGLLKLKEDQRGAEKNISDIKKIISSIEKETQDLSGIKESRKKVVKTVSPTIELPKKRSCMGSDFSVSEAACNNKLKIEKIKLDPSIYPQELLSTVDSIQDYTRAIVDGDFDRAESLSTGIENSAGRLEKMKEDLLLKVNEKLKKEGKKPLNLNEEVKQQIAKINSELKKNGLETMPSELKQVGALPASNSSLLTGSSEAFSDNSKSPDTQSRQGKLSENSSSNLGLETSQEKIDLSSFGTSETSQNDTEGENENFVSESTSNGINEINPQGDDITRDNQVSLFKQLSNRYILNYSKIFKTKNYGSDENHSQPDK